MVDAIAKAQDIFNLKPIPKISKLYQHRNKNPTLYVYIILVSEIISDIRQKE